jgi:Transposase protein
LKSVNKSLLKENQDLDRKEKRATKDKLLAEKAATKMNNERELMQKEVDRAGGLLTESGKENAMREMLQPYFSKSQLDRLLLKKQSKWSEEDLNNSILLLCLSTRVYQVLRKKYHYPLPSVSTMKNYLSKLHCCPGLMTANLKLMEVHAASLSKIEKILVMSFDEMKINSNLCYYSKEDRVLGPFKNAQVIFARPLFGTDWGTEVFYEFDVPVTVELMNYISEKLYAAGGWKTKVWTCDLGPSNRALFGQLKINADNQEFSHPVTGEKQFFMTDSPHHLKNARNHMMDTGVVLNPSARKRDQRLACKTPLCQLADLTPMAELTQKHKLTWRHIECRKMERQRVRLAAETLSASVAAALVEAGNAGRITSPHFQVSFFN